MKRSKYIITVLFCVYLTGMSAALVFLPKKEFSDVENRYLADFPVCSGRYIMNGKFMQSFENYISDHTALRDTWVRWKAYMERISGKKDNAGICFAAEETLIQLLPDPNTDTAFRNMEEVDHFTEAVGIPVYLGLIPTAAQIWKDRLPAGAPTCDEDALISALYAASAADVIDVSGTLHAHADEPLYYRTDHHWTSLGAYYGANALLESLGLEPVAASELTEVRVSDSFFGTSWSTSGASWVGPDTIETYVPETDLQITSWYDTQPEAGMLYDASKLEKKDQYSFFLGGNLPLCVIRTPAEGPKLLLIRDSYSSAMIPFLTLRFSEIHVMDMRYNRMPVQDYVNEHAIDDAVVFYGIKTFWEDSSLVFLN